MSLVATETSAAEASQPPPTDAATPGVLVIEAGSQTPLGPKIIVADDQACRLSGYDRESLVGSPLGLIYDRTDLSRLIPKLPVIAKSSDYCWMDRDLIRNSELRSKARWTIRPTKHKGTSSRDFFTLTFSPIEDPEPNSEVKDQESNNQESTPLPSIRIQSGESASVKKQIEEAKEHSVSWSAGAISHDFKNALQEILLNLEMAGIASNNAGPAGKEIRNLIGKAQLTLREAEALARQLFAIAKGTPAQSCVFNLAEVIQRVSDLTMAGSHTVTRLRIHKELRPVEGDPDQIFRVFHNLIINAIQAMPGGGTLDISATNRDYESASNEFGLPPGKYSVVSIRDRGVGISAEDLPHIFSPDFSTKEDGFGFGLASCKATIEAHGGTIRVASRLKVGTQFLIFLPSSDGEVASGTGAPDKVDAGASETDSVARCIRPSNGKARILLVEDQPGVSQSTCAILKHLGHTAYSADTGEKAIQLFRRHLDSPEPIDLVILDMNLPGGLDGTEVFAELQRLDDSIPVIATSGHFEEDSSPAVSKGFSAILAKPYTIDALRVTVDTSLGT